MTKINSRQAHLIALNVDRGDGSKLAALIKRHNELHEAAKDVLAHHRVKALPLTDTLTPRIERLKAAITK